MTAQVVTGIFGKLPAHGDFIHRNLATPGCKRLLAVPKSVLGSPG